MLRRITLAMAVSMLPAIAVSAAEAQKTAGQQAPAAQGDPSTPDPTATHDNTAPPAAEDSKKQAPAVDLSALYTAELWRNERGGIRRGWRYLDNLDLTLTIDAERALGWRGATLFVYGLYNNGHAFSGDLVGDAQIVSNIETGVRAARLYEAWIEQRFADARVSIKAGLYDLNSEFDTSDVGSLSLLSSHGIGPEFAQSGRNGPSIFPVTSLAARGEVKLGNAWLVRAAVLDGVPGDPAHPRQTVIRLRRSDGALMVGEVDYVGAGTKATVGYWRYTARFPEIGAAPSSADEPRGRGNDGAYLVVERRLTRPDEASAPDSKRGLSGFVQLGAADAQFNRISRYVGGGIVYTGVLASTGEDRIGLTLARAVFAGRYRRSVAGVGVSHAETVAEVTYRAALSPWLTIQPDAQYVVDPSARRTLADALALGLRVEVGF